MNSIRIRLLLFVFLAGTASLTLGRMCFLSFQDYHKSQENLRQSYFLQEYIKQLDVWKFDPVLLERLKDQSKIIEIENRKELLSNIIQSYADRNPSALHRRVGQFLRNEKEFRQLQMPLIKYFEKRIEYSALAILFIIIFSLMFIYVYMHGTVFREIDFLSRKMIDFLNQKYTYQFAVPSSNEMGDLQATFNSLAQKVLTQMDELKSLDQAKSDFLSIASHELRTPLTSIKGSLSLLKTGIIGNLNPTSSHLVNIAETETDRLIRLINDLLDLAKIEAHQLSLSKKWYPIQEVIKTSLDGIHGLAKTASIRLLHNEIPDIEVRLDRDRIQQVITNLISNAIKYSPRNGVVQLHVEIDESQQLIISVIDQGKGIAPEDQELIFQKFRQVTNAVNPLVKGTGLGLAIAKALVEEHQGMIGVHSEPHKGSTFYFTLSDWRSIIEENTSEVFDELSPKGAAA